MVNEKIKIKDKKRTIKKVGKISSIIIIVLVILAIAFFLGFMTKKPKTEIVLENPLKDIVFSNTNQEGVVDKNAVVEQAIIEFNEEYINYLLISLGVGKLHKSLVGYGNPKIELVIDQESWSSEINDGNLLTKKQPADSKDLIIRMSKKEAVNALLSSDIKEFLKSSVRSGNTQIEMVVGKVELGSKGYLSMYKDLTGEEIEVEE